jgi:hypothetical protein
VLGPENIGEFGRVLLLQVSGGPLGKVGELDFRRLSTAVLTVARLCEVLLVRLFGVKEGLARFDLGRNELARALAFRLERLFICAAGVCEGARRKTVSDRTCTAVLLPLHTGTTHTLLASAIAVCSGLFT